MICKYLSLEKIIAIDHSIHVFMVFECANITKSSTTLFKIIKSHIKLIARFFKFWLINELYNKSS